VGKEAAREFYAALFRSLPDYHGEFDGIVSGEDAIVAWGRFGGTLTDDLVGIPVKRGRRVSVPASFVCTFRDGQLATDTGYFDAATLATQAGVPLGRLAPSAGDVFAGRFAEFWSDPDLDRLDEYVRPDVAASFPTGQVHDIDGYRAQLAAGLELAPDLRLAVVDHLADGDRVTIDWHATCTIGGEQVEFDGSDRFRLRDGLAAEVRVAYDTRPLVEAAQRAAAPAA
jgi:predicted ester cyclase